MKADRQVSSAGKAAAAGSSPFAAVAAIMCWEAFHMVQVLWMGVIDLPVSAAEKDWTLQVWHDTCHANSHARPQHMATAFVS